MAVDAQRPNEEQTLNHPDSRRRSSRMLSPSGMSGIALGGLAGAAVAGPLGAVIGMVVGGAAGEALERQFPSASEDGTKTHAP